MLIGIVKEGAIEKKVIHSLKDLPSLIIYSTEFKWCQTFISTLSKHY